MATKKNAPAKKQPAGKVVEAVMTAGGGGGIGGLLDPRAIEQAMGQAHLGALKKGITDPDKHRELMLAAREKVKTDFRASEKKRLAAVQAEAEKGR